MYKKAIILIICLCISGMLFAQPKEVTLVVSGEGANKTEATNNALRSAIEQAFGTFVSANTTILNDEIVMDEIATISSGNIESYEELGSISSETGTVVSLKATVPIQKLVNYARSHGSSCEFAGATFGANMKQIELNKQNAKIAYDNLCELLLYQKQNFYDISIEMGNPKVSGEVSVSLIFKATQVLENAISTSYSTLKAITLSDDEAMPIKDMGYTLYETFFIQI